MNVSVLRDILEAERQKVFFRRLGKLVERNLERLRKLLARIEAPYLELLDYDLIVHLACHGHPATLDQACQCLRRSKVSHALARMQGGLQRVFCAAFRSFAPADGPRRGWFS